MRSSRAVCLAASDGFGKTSGPGGSDLVVTGRHRGGTNYHERFVFTPLRRGPYAACTTQLSGVG